MDRYKLEPFPLDWERSNWPRAVTQDNHSTADRERMATSSKDNGHERPSESIERSDGWTSVDDVHAGAHAERNAA
uniref:Transposase n=1 Tax=Steinernema glaseri TaxID=37863 RepID=A0A1I7ZFA6_9BILA